MRDMDPLCASATCRLPLSACATRMSDCCSRCSHSAEDRALGLLVSRAVES